ncbi:MAG TPA: hypothetical protein VMI75_08355 [Polyangiaceae bacterium]|nr:hypothetical protein [Polyangiaceae bacterium]
MMSPFDGSAACVGRQVGPAAEPHLPTNEDIDTFWQIADATTYARARVEHHELVVPGADMILWPAWSKTTDTLAFDAVVSASTHALWTVRPDGSGAARVLTYPNDAYSGVDWSRDGQTLVYSALEDGRMQLFAVPRAGGTPRRLSEEPTASLMHPRVSPDGRWIACTRIESSLDLMRVRVR